MSTASSNRRAWLCGLLEASLLLTALFSFATCFDDWHRLLELFTHFRLQYLVAALLLTVAFLFLRWPGYVALGVATVAVNAWFVVPWYLPAVSAAQASGDAQVRILHANVQVSNSDSRRFVELVEQSQPDLLVIQEATPAWMASLSALDELYPHKVIEPRDDPFGIALYSRFALQSSSVVTSEPLHYPEILATVMVGETALQVIAAHPTNPIGSNRAYARNLQLDAIAKLARRSPQPTIVVGDLNISMWASHYRRLIAESGLRNSREGFGVAPTWPLFLPFAMIPIDHVLVSSDIAVVDFSTGPNIGSDHLPILVSLQLR